MLVETVVKFSSDLSSYATTVEVSPDDGKTWKFWFKDTGRKFKKQCLLRRFAHRLTPNRLRHTAATFLRKEFGLDAARVILGHSSPTVTEVYAELDYEKAAQIMAQVG